MVLFFCLSSVFLYGKEWKNIETYRLATNNQELTASNWLKSDRRQNTIIWQNANRFNLNNDLSEEYQTIEQRRDFYKWINIELHKKGHEVIWPMMAHYISSKLRLLKVFPNRILIKKQVKLYSMKGSEIVFKNSFSDLKAIFYSEEVFKNEDAISWDNNILKKEQFEWIENINITIDNASLKQIERIAKGKFLYSLVIPKAIRFNGDISNPETRYYYANNQLKGYCQQIYR